MAEREGIFKRGKVWHVRTDPITGKQRSTGHGVKARALAWVAERRIEAERRERDPAHAAAQALVEPWFETFLARCKERGLSRATLGYYQQKLGHWMRILGDDARMIHINRGTVDRFVSRRRAEGAHPHTITKEVSILIRALKVAARGGVFFEDLSTLAPPDLRPEYEPRTRALKLHEVQALVAELKNPRLMALVAVSSALGLRLSEACKITQDDIDLAKGVVMVRGTKTKASKRQIPVVSLFRPLLESALPVLPIGVIRNNLYRDLDAACERAGIDRCTPNDLRRSHATILLENEVSPEVVRRILGHTSEAMLRKVYGQTSAEALGEQAEAAIARRAFVASDTIRDGLTGCDELLSARNCTGRPNKPDTEYTLGRLPKPKVARSNRAGGASFVVQAGRLSRDCRVSAREALAFFAGKLGLLEGRAA